MILDGYKNIHVAIVRSRGIGKGCLLTITRHIQQDKIIGKKVYVLEKDDKICLVTEDE